MQNIVRKNFLELHQNTIEFVRKDINLDNSNRLNESVDLLEEWLKKQNHFIKKDLPRNYLESILIFAKGSVERAKERLDKQFTFKTLMPEFFPYPVTKDHFSAFHRVIVSAAMPKLTKEHHRIMISKLLVDDLRQKEILVFYQFAVLYCEYQRMNDYNNGILFILDVRDINIFNLLTKLNPIMSKHFFQLVFEGYGTRVKRFDIISESKAVESLVVFFKQLFNAKMAKRIYSHKNLDTLHEVIEKDIMAEDYGGKEESLKKLSNEWFNALLTKEHIDFVHQLKDAKSDETYRRVDTFNEQYAGMAGSFRNLTVD